MTYDVTLTIPKHNVPSDPRERIKLLLAVFVKTVRDAESYEVIYTDFDDACKMILEITTASLQGVASGSVLIDIVRK